ncbi:atp3 gamma subunit of the F1 sector of mitochondrial F1F0 ATP synthase [Brettanomyces nanus]|uniref:ATP synthase subunit gamma n=1 Tax=Eeniella nana TaxID=13502 RepID=A0A875RWC9_EENNA|nr:atp3 gamma subunit of the F1 sector of mitochondrial F1F0 ATP synthase [Brettanomyces nanus]QPG72748.1 atp3 gamma subunit of the F1 sector of mitochondrial F1F0 ATP synthase [Brettanomyces nanus]
MFRLGASQVFRATLAARARNYATLREIEMRLKSIKNIEKITKTMKIVASTRLTKAQRAMASSRYFKGADQDFFEAAGTVAPKEAEKVLLIAVSSDKGLCGSIHSSVAKVAKAKLQDYPNADIVSIGEKVKLQLLRTHPDNIRISFTGTGKVAPTFKEASLIADEIAKLGRYDRVEIIYNKFASSVSFDSTAAPAYGKASIESSKNLSTFDIEDDSSAVAGFSDFSFANTIFSAMAEGYASEVCARRNAMDNASKNAGDMINKYSILYNRTRQAAITNELVDIITGASSLD